MDVEIAIRTGELFRLRRLKFNLTVEQVVEQLKYMNDNGLSINIDVERISMYECGTLNDNIFRQFRVVIEQWFALTETDGLANSADVCRKRTIFSADQLLVLNNMFCKNKYPSNADLMSLCCSLSLNVKIIRNWFVNKRYLLKTHANNN